jgi:CRP-like cAMP-binding protein
MHLAKIQAAWDGPPQCEHCGIRHLVLFSSLEQDDFSLIHEPINERHFDKGEVLYREGALGHHVFTVREGVVKLVHYAANGEERIVRLLRRGDVAGLEALLGQPYHHEAIPLDPALTCRIPVGVINDLNQRLPFFHRELMVRWQRAVNEADAWLAELNTGSVKARVARLLLRLVEPESGDTCFMPTREDIGSMLAVTTESVSRAAAEFKRSGVIENVGPRRVKVKIDGLKWFAN